MQLDKLIDDLKKFKQKEYLEKEFRELFDKINILEICTANAKFDQFTYNSPTVINQEIVFNEVLVTLKNFRLQQFKAKINLIYDRLNNTLDQEKSTIYQIFISKLNKLQKDLTNNNPEYSEELTILIKYLKDYNIRSTKNHSFKYKDGGKYNKINKLFNLLREAKLIDYHTDTLDFERVFQNKPIEKLIQWSGNTSQLKCFIQIVNYPQNGFEDNGDEKWRIAVNCFSKTKKRSFDKITFKNLRTYKITESTKRKMNSLIEALGFQIPNNSKQNNETTPLA